MKPNLNKSWCMKPSPIADVLYKIEKMDVHTDYVLPRNAECNHHSISEVICCLPYSYHILTLNYFATFLCQ